MCMRMQARKKVNKLDNLTTGKAVDALLNYETVKLFNNEQFEVRQTQFAHSLSCTPLYHSAGITCPWTRSLTSCALCRWMSMICFCPDTSRRLWPRRMWQLCLTQARASSCRQASLPCSPLLPSSALWAPSQPATW